MLSGAVFRNGIDHIEDMVGDAGGADGFHILRGDYIPIETIADQLLQLHLDILHVRAGLGEQQLCGILGDFFPSLPKIPAIQRFREFSSCTVNSAA